MSHRRGPLFVGNQSCVLLNQKPRLTLRCNQYTLPFQSRPCFGVAVPKRIHVIPVFQTGASTFYGIRSIGRNYRYRRTRARRHRPTFMLLDPWSVSPAAADMFAAQCFAASLLPYLGFLYLLGRDESNCPKLANFGFRFLLLFVGASIPAGIAAKTYYHDILANVDWLHGAAESLLTATNLFIVLGFRQALNRSPVASSSPASDFKKVDRSSTAKAAFLGTLGLVLFSLTPAVFAGVHPEPANALSYPTWIIHISSLIEWLAAMDLVWNYANVTQNMRWRGLTWGMLPLHTSGICACVYHFFYNAPGLNVLVAIQAALTFLGNSTMCLAMYRVFNNGKSLSSNPQSAGISMSSSNWRDQGESVSSQVERQPDSTTTFLLKLLLGTAGASALVKWGELYIDAPFKPSLVVALLIVTVPTIANALKWVGRSNSGRQLSKQS